MKPPPHTEVNMPNRPYCDFCWGHGKRVPASVDCKTKHGPWAYCCELCFGEHGVGLGEGLGQRLIVET